MTQARLAPLIFLAAISAMGLIWSGEAGGASEGERCGGFPGIKCDDGLWCDPDPGKCGVADVGGTCVTVPEICTEAFMPVCGCDNHTYSNDCHRRAAKVAKAADSECDATKCTEEQVPVCATKNDKRTTYGNDCKARRDGATDITKGACEDVK